MKQPEPRSVAPLLRDVLRAVESILAFTKGMDFAEYEKDDKTRWAVERQFITVGEALGAAWKVEPALDQKISRLRQIIAFRNNLVHGYERIQNDFVWAIITNDVTRLTTEAKALLATLPDPQTPA